MFHKLYFRLSPFFKAVVQNLGFGTGKCRYTPTCSRYSKDALKKYGPIKGTFLSLKRVLKCHPWSPGGYDPA